MIVPPYALFRNPAYFSPAPDSFWPDRWLQSGVAKRTPHSASTASSVPTFTQTGETEVITNHAAFIPFSYGPANCAGRALALAEMRVVVALLMQRFEMRFKEGWDPKEWEDHLEDHFVMSNGGLPIVLRPRI